MTKPAKRPRPATPDAAVTDRGSASPFIFPEISSRLRTIVDPDSASSWTDYRTLQADFRASARIAGGFVAAEYAIEAEDTVGRLFAFAHVARPDLGPITFRWHDDGSGEHGCAFAPDDLARMAMMFHAIGDVFRGLGEKVAADLPELREQAAAHRTAWTRINRPDLADTPRYADAAWIAAHDAGSHIGATTDAE